MLQRFKSFIAEQHLFNPTEEVLLAVSGGRDSVAMCELMHQSGYPFSIAHCNFHLRPGDCDRDEQFVRALAEHYNCRFFVAQFNTFDAARDNGRSIEEEAREERYAFFDELCQKYGFPYVLTAHHRDDSTESFFLNLLRGTGIAGLHGILPKVGNRVRPMLCFSRSEINAFVQSEGLEYVEDYTNQLLDSKRNQIRLQVMPLLRSISPHIDDAMTATISHLQAVEKVYRATVNKLKSDIVKPRENEVFSIGLGDVQALNPQITLLFEVLREYGFSADVVSDLLRDLNGQVGRRFYSSTHIIEQRQSEFLIYPLSTSESQVPCLNYEISNQSHNHLTADTACFDADRLHYPLHLRHWRDGDRFHPFGMKGSKLLSDFFVDVKMPRIEKDRVWLLCDADDSILWVVGLRADGRYAVNAATTRKLFVSLPPNGHSGR